MSRVSARVCFNIHLLSGRKEFVSLPESKTLGDLRAEAQRVLKMGCLGLFTLDGTALDTKMLIKDVDEGFRDLLAVKITPKLVASSNAFALCCNGAVITWGDPAEGGDSSEVADQLKQVQDICATRVAFAALIGAADSPGRVVTWGDHLAGGDSEDVQLTSVLRLSATQGAFAAVLADGSVRTWGFSGLGGDCSDVKDQLVTVTQICGSTGAFAAILEDGRVVTWGRACDGGDSSAVESQLTEVQQIVSSQGAFVARRADGTVVAWGNRRHGGEIPEELHAALLHVQDLAATDFAFAAICGPERTVVTWGSPHYGGDSSTVKEQLVGVQQIRGNTGAFAAILEDGTAVVWGHMGHGADAKAIEDQLKGVQKIATSQTAFCAMLQDGSVVTWGNGQEADSRLVSGQLKGVLDVQGSRHAFAAITAEGDLVTWGHRDSGGFNRTAEEAARRM